MAALPAEAAELAPRAAMMAEPRLATVGMKSFFTHSSSTRDGAALPSTVANVMSGTMAGEWLPQTAMCSIEATGAPVFSASCDMARFWSRRSMAEKHFGSRSGAFFMAIQALVLHGLPTTSTLTLRLAATLRAWPCWRKMAALASSRSARSMPGPRGRAPMRSATSQSRKASTGS